MSVKQKTADTKEPKRNHWNSTSAAALLLFMLLQ